MHKDAIRTWERNRSRRSTRAVLIEVVILVFGLEGGDCELVTQYTKKEPLVERAIGAPHFNVEVAHLDSELEPLALA